jgi:hypothetical protein
VCCKVLLLAHQIEILPIGSYLQDLTLALLVCASCCSLKKPHQHYSPHTFRRV